MHSGQCVSQGEQPMNGKGEGMLCPPCPQHVCKGGGGHAGEVRCSPGRGDCCWQMKRRGVAHCPSCTPGMCTKRREGRAEQSKVGQGRGQGKTGWGGMGQRTAHEWEENAHYPVCILFT